MAEPPARAHPTTDRGSGRGSVVMVLSAIVLLGAVLRLWQIREPLWVDELHTSWCAMGAWSDVSVRAHLGNQSTPYFFLSWLSIRLCGNSEWGLRLPSLIVGLALIPTAYYVAKRWSRL